MTNAPSANNEPVSLFLQNLNIGITLLNGTEFRPEITSFLRKIRTTFSQSKIVLITYERHWSEADIFEYFDDVAAVKNENLDGLSRIAKGRNVDFLFEVEIGKSPENTSESWVTGFQRVKTLGLAAGTVINIYTKGNPNTPSTEAIIMTFCSGSAYPSGSLHREILREIEILPPIETIALFPWRSEHEKHMPARSQANWVEIARRLIEAGYEILVPGTAENYAAAIAFKEATALPGIRLSAGRATLRQTAILLGRARGAICAPGAIANLAALAGTPLVILDESRTTSDTAATAVESLLSMVGPRKIGA